MSKKSVPQTSKDALASLDPEHLRKMHRNILYALGQIPGGGTWEELARILKMKNEQVWKRLNEMERIGLIHRAGRKMLSSGRQGTNWKVLSAGASIVMPEKSIPGPTVSDYSKAILQQSLF